MAQIDIIDIPKEDKEKALQAIIDYARQNPIKYALKKDALLARYGITELNDEVVEIPDSEEVKELEEIKKKVTKSKK